MNPFGNRKVHQRINERGKWQQKSGARGKGNGSTGKGGQRRPQRRGDLSQAVEVEDLKLQDEGRWEGLEQEKQVQRQDLEVVPPYLAGLQPPPGSPNLAFLELPP